MSDVRDVLVVALGPVGGLVIGYLWSQYLKASAVAAVKVRPALADVGLLDAALTGHATDWLFYHAPEFATYAYTTLAIVVVTISWWVAVLAE